jgi:hypothetical protein
MNRLLLCAALLPALALAAEPQRGLSRGKVVNAEKLINTQLAGMYPDEPWFLLGPARGVYLEGYGVVFTAEINLATGPTQTPFKMEITKEEIARHREKKITRLPELRAAMAKLMGFAADYLDSLAPGEQLVLGITLLRYPYEDPKIAPSQIVMQSDRARILDARKRQAPVDSVVRAVEY